MSKQLVIVESPAKASTIQKYLGKEYEVAASLGHVRDLPKKGMSIDIEHNFKPTYEVSADKKKIITALKKQVKSASSVILASDPDREGEAISWHLCHVLGLDPKKTKRVVFHEITKPGIEAAMAKPRSVDEHLVDAQQARRVLDRLVGYELSPVLWKKVKPGLSAGRVQSVAARLIVEREREIEQHQASNSFKVQGFFDVEGAELKAELSRKLADAAEAHKVLEALVGAKFAVSSLETKPGKRTPAAPFITSTLQQEASRKLGFTPRQTMSVAQRLYEAGFITYMRTDSVNLSQTALEGAAATIKSEYGEKYAQRRTYKTKSAGAQEAHEAIRPTDFGRSQVDGERNQQRLYELIWQRAIASQMADAAIEKTVASITPDKTDELFTAQAEAVRFDGFLKVYSEGRDDEEEESSLLPPLNKGQILPLVQIVARQQFSRPKARYTEASLVRKLEEMEIGRPSTYAPTISTIQDRGYVMKADIEPKERQIAQVILKDDAVTEQEVTENYGGDRNKLIPTPVGDLVTDFLIKFFPKIVDYDFTAKVEGEFDQIEAGSKQWQKMIADFYRPFHDTVEAAEQVSRQEASQARLIGTHPKTNRPIYARLGKYGPMLQMGEAEDETKPVFAPIPEGTKLGDITMEQALKLYSLPRLVGQTEEGEDIMANFGPFGPYVKAGTTSASIRPDSPFEVELDRARELIKEKRVAAANRIIAEFDDGKIQVLNGRFGPYISDGKKNAKIPKDTDPKSITRDQAAELLASAPVRKARRRVRKS
ncbi:type I DNA topoisomerase [Patescibacteria group bacterium]|nr:MAG: type I DNA topoisomerase [Patescibacteria group bacterium]